MLNYTEEEAIICAEVSLICKNVYCQAVSERYIVTAEKQAYIGAAILAYAKLVGVMRKYFAYCITYRACSDMACLVRTVLLRRIAAIYVAVALSGDNIVTNLDLRAALVCTRSHGSGAICCAGRRNIDLVCPVVLGHSDFLLAALNYAAADCADLSRGTDRVAGRLGDDNASFSCGAAVKTSCKSKRSALAVNNLSMECATRKIDTVGLGSETDGVDSAAYIGSARVVVRSIALADMDLKLSSLSAVSKYIIGSCLCKASIAAVYGNVIRKGGLSVLIEDTVLPSLGGNVLSIEVKLNGSSVRPERTNCIGLVGVTESEVGYILTLIRLNVYIEVILVVEEVSGSTVYIILNTGIVSCVLNTVNCSSYVRNTCIRNCNLDSAADRALSVNEIVSECGNGGNVGGNAACAEACLVTDLGAGRSYNNGIIRGEYLVTACRMSKHGLETGALCGITAVIDSTVPLPKVLVACAGAKSDNIIVLIEESGIGRNLYLEDVCISV